MFHLYSDLSLTLFGSENAKLALLSHHQRCASFKACVIESFLLYLFILLLIPLGVGIVFKAATLQYHFQGSSVSFKFEP